MPWAGATNIVRQLPHEIFNKKTVEKIWIKKSNI
jgi:hypothetical protein